MRITAELVQKAKQGDSEAWTELYSATYPIAFGVAMQLVKNKDVVDDMLQDSYINAFTKLDTLEDNEKFQSWFNRIVANNCKNYLVKKKPELFSEKAKYDDEGNIEEFDVEDDREEYQPDSAVMNDEIKSLFYDMVDKLPEEQKACVLMCWVQGLSIAETAEILGVSENTVKSRLHYAKKKLTGEAEQIKKNGISVFSLTGFALIPFLRWLFAEGSGVAADAQAAKGVIEVCKASAPAISTATGAVETAKVVSDTAQAVEKTSGLAKIGKSLGMKIGAGVAAAAVATTGTVAAVTANNAVKAEDYIPETVYCEGYDGYGSLNAENDVIDIEKLEKALCGKNIDEYYEYCELTGESVEDYIEIETDMLQNGELSNGDKVEYTVSIDYDKINEMDGVNKKFKGKDEYKFTCEVQGLKKLNKVDIFSIIGSIGVKTFSSSYIGDNYPLIINFKDDTYKLEFDDCIITWDDLAYNSIEFKIEYIDEEGNPIYDEFRLDFDPPKGSKYIFGDTIPASVNVEKDEFLHCGIVFVETEKECVVDSMYTLMKNTNISDESFNILKTNAERKAVTVFGNTLIYSNAFIAVTEVGTPSYLVFSFTSPETGMVYGYEYANFPIDQNGNVLDAKEMTPSLWTEFMHGSAFDSEEELKESLSDWAPIIKDIEK